MGVQSLSTLATLKYNSHEWVYTGLNQVGYRFTMFILNTNNQVTSSAIMRILCSDDNYAIDNLIPIGIIFNLISLVVI